MKASLSKLLWICTFILLHFNVNKLYSQTKAIDSLYTAIARAQEDTLKVGLFVELNKALFVADLKEEMIPTSDQGINLSKALDYPLGIAQLKMQKGIAYQLLGEGEKAIALYLEGVKVAKKHQLEELESKFYTNIGGYYYRKGDLDIGLNYYLKAYELKNVITKQNLGRLLNNIAIIYRLQEKNKEAELLYLESLALKKEVNDSLGIAASLLNLGRLNHLKGSNEHVAIKQLQESLGIFRLLNRPYDIAIVQVALGQIYFELEKNKEAKEILNKAWGFFKTNPNTEYGIKVLAILGALAQEEKAFERAEGYYTESLKLLGNDRGKKQDRVEILDELSQVKKALDKDSEAYQLLRESYAMDQELNKDTRLVAMEEMQTKFDVVQKEQLITEQNLKIEKNKAQRNLLVVGLLSLFLLILAIIAFYRKRIKYRAKITQQEKELQQEKITKLQQENRITALDSMIAGQEQERARIAQDLHDSLGGLLSSVKSYFQASQQQDKNTDTVSKTTSLLDQASNEVRRISHNMMPHALTIAGLKDAIADIGERLEKEKYKVTLEINDLPKLDETQEIMIYRLVQELVFNIKKHAQAKDVFIQLYAHDDTVHLTVEDDGKGFDLSTIISDGIGLKGVKSRVAYLNGDVVWDSEPGKGTTVHINFAA